MTDSTREMLERQVSAQLDYWVTALDFVEAGAEPDEMDPDEYDPDLVAEIADQYDSDSDALDVLNDDALSVEYEWTGSNRAEAEVSTVRIVLATGGPHVEIIAEMGRGLRIEGYWGGETVRRHFDHGPTEGLAEMLAELAEVSG